MTSVSELRTATSQSKCKNPALRLDFFCTWTAPAGGSRSLQLGSHRFFGSMRRISLKNCQKEASGKFLRSDVIKLFMGLPIDGALLPSSRQVDAEKGRFGGDCRRQGSRS